MRDGSGTGFDEDLAADGVDLLRTGVAVAGGTATLTAAMHLLTTVARAGVTGADDVALTVRLGRRLTTAAATGDLSIELDALQHRHGGPGIEALDTASVVHSADLGSEGRWPDFVAAALSRTGVRSVLAFRLGLGPGEPVGSLTLCSCTPHAFDDASIVAAGRLADYGAAVLAYARERETVTQLDGALESSREIGAAVGILMVNNRMTRDGAFDLLRVSSQDANLKVRAIAAYVIRTGALPEIIGP